MSISVVLNSFVTNRFITKSNAEAWTGFKAIQQNRYTFAQGQLPTVALHPETILCSK